jgi:hypothetical protein
MTAALSSGLRIDERQRPSGQAVLLPHDLRSALSHHEFQSVLFPHEIQTPPLHHDLQPALLPDDRQSVPHHEDCHITLSHVALDAIGWNRAPNPAAIVAFVVHRKSRLSIRRGFSRCQFTDGTGDLAALF